MVSRRLAVVLCVVAVTGAGCSASPETPAGRSDDASARADACTRLLRELRLYCKETIRDDHAATRMDCMSRRLQLERQCL